MALGKIKADTLEHSTAGSLDTSYVVNGSAKAYSEQNNNTSGAPINQSLNQSSITDSATGHKIHNFTSAFSNSTYLLLVGACGNRTGTSSSMRGIAPDGDWTSTAADVRYAYTSTVIDDTRAGAGFIGDLA